MNTIEATIRNTNTKGEVNSLRIKGNIPAIVYGGSNKNQKISLSKKNIKNLIEKENFLSNIISINLEGKSENVLPKEIVWDPITDEPIHIDFLRIVKGSKIILEIPFNFNLSEAIKKTLGSGTFINFFGICRNNFNATYISLLCFCKWRQIG